MSRFRRKSIVYRNDEFIYEDDEILIDWILLRTPPLVLCDGCMQTERCPTKFDLPDGWIGGFYDKRHFCSKCVGNGRQ